MTAEKGQGLFNLLWVTHLLIHENLSTIFQMCDGMLSTCFGWIMFQHTQTIQVKQPDDWHPFTTLNNDSTHHQQTMLVTYILDNNNQTHKLYCLKSLGKQEQAYGTNWTCSVHVRCQSDLEMYQFFLLLMYLNSGSPCTTTLWEHIHQADCNNLIVWFISIVSRVIMDIQWIQALSMKPTC